MNNNEEVNSLLAAMTLSGLIGLVVGIFRGVIQQKHGTFGAFARGIMASILVAVIVNWGLADTSLSINYKSMITGICSFIADDILLGLLSLASLLGKDPLGFLARVTAAYRGQVQAQEKDKP